MFDLRMDERFGSRRIFNDSSVDEEKRKSWKVRGKDLLYRNLELAVWGAGV